MSDCTRKICEHGCMIPQDCPEERERPSSLAPVAGALPSCECVNWARNGQPPLTSHHPRCTLYDPVGESMALVRRLRKGIESWAADEDGVHPECWEAYKEALVYLGDLAAIAKVYES